MNPNVPFSDVVDSLSNRLAELTPHLEPAFDSIATEATAPYRHQVLGLGMHHLIEVFHDCRNEPELNEQLLEREAVDRLGEYVSLMARAAAVRRWREDHLTPDLDFPAGLDLGEASREVHIQLDPVEIPSHRAEDFRIVRRIDSRPPPFAALGRLEFAGPERASR